MNVIAAPVICPICQEEAEQEWALLAEELEGDDLTYEDFAFIFGPILERVGKDSYAQFAYPSSEH